MIATSKEAQGNWVLSVVGSTATQKWATYVSTRLSVATHCDNAAHQRAEFGPDMQVQSLLCSFIE